MTVQQRKNDASKKRTVAIEIVTPEMAKAYLVKNTHNRDLKKKSIQRYTKDIREGRWIPSACMIVFGEDGTLLDGQNRLEAIVKANMPVEMVVVRNVPNAAQATIDTCSLRTVSDMFKLNDIPNHTVVGTVVKRYQAYKAKQFYNSMKEFSNIQTKELYEEMPEKYNEAAKIGIVYNRQYCSLSKAVFGALYLYLTIDLGHSKEQVIQFLDEVSDAIPSENSTLSVFRKYIRNMEAVGNIRKDDGRKVKYLCRTWNAWLKGQEYTKFSANIENLWFK